MLRCDFDQNVSECINRCSVKTSGAVKGTKGLERSSNISRVSMIGSQNNHFFFFSFLLCFCYFYGSEVNKWEDNTGIVESEV